MFGVFPQALKRPQQEGILEGTATVNTDESKFGTHSLSLAGSYGGYVSVRQSQPNLFTPYGQPLGADTSSSGLGNGTIEFFFLNDHVNYPGTYVLLYDQQEVSTEIDILLRSNNTLAARFDGIGDTGLYGLAAVGTWNHVALTLEENKYGTLWLNGQRKQTVGDGINTLVTSGGSWNRLGLSSPQAHYNEYRLSTIARYDRSQSTYTVPTEPFVNDQYTYWLFHFDGNDDITNKLAFDDVYSMREPATITADGGAQISTSESMFGSSLALNITDLDSADRATVIPANDIHFSTNDFTIEAWYNSSYDNTGWRYLWDLRNWSSPNSTPFLLTVSGSIRVYTEGTNKLGYTWTPTAGTWYHLAVVRHNGTTSLYINGTSVGTPFTDLVDYPATPRTVVGSVYSGASGNCFNGYVDEFRISKSARYTSNFTPSTKPFVNDSDTLLLIHADGTNGSTTITDDIG